MDAIRAGSNSGEHSEIRALRGSFDEDGGALSREFPNGLSLRSRRIQKIGNFG